jgi:YD repeat-containing protein
MSTQGGVVPVGGSPVTQQNSYYPTRIVDRNGNALNFTYTSVNAMTAISQITASDGRTVTFNYANNALASITEGTRTWIYKYDTTEPFFPFLTEVVRPDGLSWKYAYNLMPGPGAGVYSMKQLTYPTGGTFDYTYGFVQFSTVLPRTTVVTGKTGVGRLWTYSYNPATQNAFSSTTGTYVFDNDATMDRTYVVAPDGVHTYAHAGANSLGSGAIFAIGLSLFKSVDNGYQNEGTAWQAQVISNMINQRPGAPESFDPQISAPLAGLQVIQRNGQNYQTANSSFDEFGNARTIVETGTTTNNVPDTRTTQRTFNILPDKWILHQPKDETVSTIGTIARTFDPNGNLLTENKYGVITRFTYTGEGEIATRQDARGNTVNFDNYKRGIAQSETHPEAVNLTRTVDDAGNVAIQTDGEGVITRYAYDSLNRLTAITLPAGNPVTIAWGTNSRVVQRGLFKETTTYDGYGRATRVLTEGGAVGPITQNHRYDALGRKTFTTYPNQTVGTAFRYDALGRVTITGHVVIPGGGGLTIFGDKITGGFTTSKYASNRVINTTERNLAYTLTYRGYGSPDRLELMQVEAPEATANVAITRNGIGQPLTVQQGGLTRSYGYDTRFFLTSETNPETGDTLYGRDAIGNMVSRQVGTSPVTTFTYDGRNRLNAILYPAGTPSVTKNWFRDDLVRSIDNGVTRREFTYSPNKKLTRETLAVDARVFGVDYTYDLNDAHATVAYSTGTTVNYNPDALGWPTQAAPFANAVAFQPTGALKQLIYANGAVSDFTLDPRQRPSNVTTTMNASPIINLTNQYDNSNNVTAILDAVSGEQNRTFGYDALDRLNTVSMPGISSGSIVYSGTGNILSQQLGTNTLSYQYDSNNRVNTISGSRSQTFTYDVFGNVASNSRNQFQYDNGSMLRCVDCGTATEIRYDYDGAGMRVSETKGPFKTYFMYGSSGELMFETDSNGVKREYGYVGGRNIARKVSQ